MQSFLLRHLPIAILALTGTLLGTGCVYDPYYYDEGYYRPNAYMMEPGGYGDGGPRYRNGPRGGYDGYGYERRPRSRQGRSYGFRNEDGRRGGRTEYLDDDREPVEMDDDRDDHRRAYDDEEMDSDRDRDRGLDRDRDRDREMAENEGRSSQGPPSLREDVPGSASGGKPGGSAAPKMDPSEIKTATRTKNPGRVKSPYPPYPELDVSGMNSGSLAKDPNTGKVFRIP